MAKLYLSHNESRYKTTPYMLFANSEYAGMTDPKYPPGEEPWDGDDDFEYE